MLPSKNMCWRCDGTDISEEEMMKCNVCEKAKYCNANCLRADKYRHKVDCDNASAKFHCHGCRKTGENMQQCSNCLTAWFCSKECRKRSWESHKIRCLEVNGRIAEVYLKMAFHFQSGNECPFNTIYYWGNTPAVDLINLPMNEGNDYTGPLNLLLCGVADPRSVCLSLASLPNEYTGQVTFVLNDICLCALARVVLLLYLIIKGGKSKANSVTQIWYSLYLSADDHAFLVSALQDLTRVSNLELITRGILHVKAKQLTRLKTVWKGWLLLSNFPHIRLQEQRIVALKPFENALALYQDVIPRKFKRSAQEWLKHGVLQIETDTVRLGRENVSLTGFIPQLGEGVEDLHYCVPEEGLPFSCWDYRAAIKVFPDASSLQDLYGKYIAQVIQGTATRLEKSEAVKIKCILGDCLDLPHEIPIGSQFDRITTSNLWDYIPLLNLLRIAPPLLDKSNPCSVILTEAQGWNAYFPEIFPLAIQAEGGDPDLTGVYLSPIRQTALNDTGNHIIASSGGCVAYMEYYNFMEYFLDYLRASLLPVSKPIPKFMPSLKKLAEGQGLIVRDPTQLENRIAPFRFGVNCRKPTMTPGTKLTVEWVLKK